jgi:predicted nucleic acid-binding Zn ribbon protein
LARNWTHLSGALMEAIRRLQLEPVLREGRALTLWEEIVGEQVAEATRAEDVRDGALLVVVRSSTWAFELTFHKEKILRDLNRRLGRSTLRDIRFHVGSLEEPAVALPLEPVPSSEILAQQPLSAETSAEIDAAVCDQPDPELRERIARSLATGHRRGQWLGEHGYRPCPQCGALHRGRAPECPACRCEARPREEEWLS